MFLSVQYCMYSAQHEGRCPHLLGRSYAEGPGPGRPDRPVGGSVGVFVLQSVGRSVCRSVGGPDAIAHCSLQIRCSVVL